jgi:hypothetical protein
LFLLLRDGLRLLLRLLFFCEPQVGLRHIDQDRTVCFKRDGARKVKALLRFASELFRPGTSHGPPTRFVRYPTNLNGGVAFQKFKIYNWFGGKFQTEALPRAMATWKQRREWRKECETQGERWVRGQEAASLGGEEKLQYMRRWLRRRETFPYMLGAMIAGVASIGGTIVGALLTAFLAAGCPK